MGKGFHIDCLGTSENPTVGEVHNKLTPPGFWYPGEVTKRWIAIAAPKMQNHSSNESSPGVRQRNECKMRLPMLSDPSVSESKRKSREIAEKIFILMI